ncbi:hypothetical protein KC343_g572 [Hortaea werneckii]|nr:hypothetical protein KC352_g4369 [Hortaea werneckii]KAI7572504.1 hypothetical protein KC317_g702 [Hortaea werneckii]KAI7627626.1 hypothetical protein KC346_g657 [Hortaea werneckii]KAI7637688.1 hypothetical protein KC343_g572 [Hortaea werneckii]KAI7683137.1 hypothetical protein KC319_g611 [Hortaea werneckii]
MSDRSPRITSLDRLYDTLRFLRAGRAIPSCERTWRAFRLTAQEYKELQYRLQCDETLRGWYEDKVRYDWVAPSTRRQRPHGCYVLRMPSRVQELFTVKVTQAFEDGIKALVQELERSGNFQTALALETVESGGSPTLELPAPELESSSQDTSEEAIMRGPDATFFHPKQEMLPTMVVEVGCPQDGKDLSWLAESYVVDSRHEIGCVAGFNIPYASSARTTTIEDTTSVEKKEARSATVSIWRRSIAIDEEGDEIGMCTCAVEAVPFRCANGEVCEGAIELKLSDLLPAAAILALPSSIASDHMIKIPFATLAASLAAAEAADCLSRPTVQRRAGPRKWRKRTLSPGVIL